MLKKIAGVIAVILYSFSANAQQGEEVLLPLKGNPVLKHLANTKTEQTFKRKSGVKDTLLLPFFDDFSKGGVFPDEKHWTDRHAYINTDFAIKPPSIGVATLDALDSTGRPYLNIRADLHGPCDTLTSQPIDISAYGVGNNIYLSFFYQAQGLSFQPLVGSDSLVLQFKTFEGYWYTEWSTRGFSLQDFKKAIVKIDSTPYFHAGFQFRFINYQNYYGGIGQWHLDYIYMERNRADADTLFADVAVSQKPMSFLRDYQEMPYNQFAGFEGLEVTDSTYGFLSNLLDQGRTVDIFNREVRDESGAVVVNVPGSGFTIGPNTEQGYGYSSAFTPSVLAKDTVSFFASEYMKITGANVHAENDSVGRKLTFGNYYAYDDGTAESGYGLHRGAGKIAYRFRTNKPDTLRAISVYYFQAEDTIKKPFSLAVWQSITPNSFEEKLAHTRLVTYPSYTDSINGYYTYILDSAIAVNGEFYIGWIQTSTFHLNVGWDRNYTRNRQAIANPGIYFNTTGKWYLSEVPGTLMMRPHLGKEIIVVDTTVLSNRPVINTRSAKSLTVYPNPASSTLTVALPTDDNYEFKVCDITGKTLLTGMLDAFEENTLNINPLPNGLYFIILHNPTQGEYRTKFIKY